MTNELISKLIDGIRHVENLIDESRGIAGLHLNGEEAPWSELRTGGRYEGWLRAFDEAIDAANQIEQNPVNESNRRRLTEERLTELRSKVEHGFNLLASEACEVFAHYGEPIAEARKRCAACGGEGSTSMTDKYLGRRICLECGVCNGTGYEVAK